MLFNFLNTAKIVFKFIRDLPLILIFQNVIGFKMTSIRKLCFE